MPRAPFQILVFPCRTDASSKLLYAVFRRGDSGAWQGVAGGGEEGETPLAAAKRESFEEAGIGRACRWLRLKSMSTIPVEKVCGFMWGPDVPVIPEYCFGVEVPDERVRLSAEHDAVRWLPFEKALRLLEWDSNKNALWELNWRLGAGRDGSKPVSPSARRR